MEWFLFVWTGRVIQIERKKTFSLHDFRFVLFIWFLHFIYSTLLEQKVAGTKSREVTQYFFATINSRDFLFSRLFAPVRYAEYVWSNLITPNGYISWAKVTPSEISFLFSANQLYNQVALLFTITVFSAHLSLMPAFKIFKIFNIQIFNVLFRLDDTPVNHVNGKCVDLKAANP